MQTSKYRVIFEFQGNEISLTYEEARALIDRIETAMNKSVVAPQVESYMKVFDSFIDGITK